MKYFLKRTLAYLLDCTLCYSLVMLIVQWLILRNIREPLGITEDWFSISLNMEIYVLLTISMPVWIYFTYFDSDRASSTFGKRLMKLAVYDSGNNKLSLRISFLRTLLKLAPWEIAHVGIIFPTPIYFEKNPEIRMLTIVGIVLFVIYALSIFFNTSRQTLYDKCLGTQVLEIKK